MSGKLRKPIEDVRPEDLLGRRAVRIDTKDANSFIKDKIVLVTGAGGAIGSELCRQVAELTPKLLIGYDHNENDIYFLELELNKKYSGIGFKTIIGDIQDVDLLKHTFSKYRPHIVLHSAAHKHVPLMEQNPAAAVKNNIIGTKNIVDVAEYYGTACFVMVSTDKAVNPAGVMGASKRIAEMMMQTKAKTSKTKFMAVRFGNVIGSSGSVIPIFKQQIKAGGPITITHPDSKRFFMTAAEAAQLIIQAGAVGKGSEIFVLDMGKQVKIVDLAKNLIALSGLVPNEDIKIEFIGLRPGEKIYDEVLFDAKHDKATRCDKIYIKQQGDFNHSQLSKDIKTLEQLATSMAEDKIIKKIREMILSYKLVGKHDGNK